MKFKISKILSDRQLKKVKFSCSAAIIFCCFQILSEKLVNAGDPISWDGAEWFSQDETEFSRGRIHYYSSNTEVCNSWVLIPGTAILPKGLLAVAYCATLIYLFMGISIVSDIFMGAIEKITSKKIKTQIGVDSKNEPIYKDMMFWNPTVANLTLMALGSSAPEILLSCIETIGGLNKCPGELGASTIVGSAAFNLLVISGVSIYAVTEENDTDISKDTTVPLGVKKINDMGVFTITCFFGLFAYIWLFICVKDNAIEPWEAWSTFAMFFVLIILAFVADKIHNAASGSSLNEPLLDSDEKKEQYIDFSYKELVTDLVDEQIGKAKHDKESSEQRIKMKQYLKDNFKTDNIQQVNHDELRKKMGGESLLSKCKYKQETGLAYRKPLIKKKQKMIKEGIQATNIAHENKNEDFGFQCIHYSVSEAQGTMQIPLLNKKQQACSVRVKTVNAEAMAGEDYIAVDRVVHFKEGQKSEIINVQIIDDDNWEPDEDFFVKLYHCTSEEEELIPYSGTDAECRITIIDDDYPGQICFDEKDTIKASATTGYATVVVKRINGSDGVVTVDYMTKENKEYGASAAIAGMDFVEDQGTLIFQNSETEKTIKVKIVPHVQEGPKPAERDEYFSVQLSNITPTSKDKKAGAILTKKDTIKVNIVTDDTIVQQRKLLKQLMKKMIEQEETSYVDQFIQACMLHPTKNEDGFIDDIAPFDAAFHFICIGWKIFFALIPPVHWIGGWAAFIGCLCLIGVVTAVVGEFANLFGCVLGIKPSITAITFVALGTSLPDTFASMAAAKAEKYADAAVGNVTGSNSVNVFLGLGLPWVIAVTSQAKFTTDKGPGGWSANKQAKFEDRFGQIAPESGVSLTDYYVPAGSLGFSVVVFVSTALICVLVLLVRRCRVGGELGGTKNGRTISCGFLCTLWGVYVVMSIMQAYKIGGLDKIKIGALEEKDLSDSIKYWLVQCDKSYKYGDYKSMVVDGVYQSKLTQ